MAQVALAHRFNGDASVKDLPRVRLPGFFHRKGEPFQTRVVSLEPFQPYRFDELVQRLGLDLRNAPPEPAEPPPGSDRVPHGQRNAMLSREAWRLRKQGRNVEQIAAVLLAMNAAVCDPPLAEAEVRTIARGKQNIEPEAETPPRQFKLLSVADLHAMPRMRWLIRAALPESGCGAIFGPSTSGKSFLALDMVAALAERREWFGHGVKKANVRIVVIVLEGEAGFRLRVEAWEKANGRPFPDSVRFVFGAFALNDREDVLGLAAAIHEAGGADLIAIDTLNRTTPGADENSAKDMSATLQGCAQLQATTGGFVLLVHHQGKDATKGMRGHSSLFAAMDCVLEVSRTDDVREWSMAKAKDGSDGQTHTFRLEVVELGEDEDGDTVSSCIVKADHAPVSKRPQPPKGGNQRIVFDVLQPVFREAYHFGKAGAPAMRPCITLNDAINAARERLTVDPKRRTERTRQAITGLVASGVLGCNEDWLWLV